jgi:hypothetical protein
MTLSFQHRLFHVAKHGNSATEYEDAFAIGEHRLAVADGASESAFAKEWAEILTRTFIEDPEAVDQFESWLKHPRDLWSKKVDRVDLPWFLQEKIQQGAHATFLGWEMFSIGNEWAWNAMVVGDCNLFQIRDQRLHVCFPMTDSSQFHTSPTLLSSLQGKIPVIQRTSDELSSGDRFWLMTDAIACWFLQQVEGGVQPWDFLAKVESQEHFEFGIKKLRETGKLKNDDVTAVEIVIS